MLALILCLPLLLTPVRAEGAGPLSSSGTCAAATEEAPAQSGNASSASVQNEHLNTAEASSERLNQTTTNVCSIGNTFYTSLQAAINAAADGDNIQMIVPSYTLPADDGLITINKSITISGSCVISPAAGFKSDVLFLISGNTPIQVTLSNLHLTNLNGSDHISNKLLGIHVRNTNAALTLSSCVLDGFVNQGGGTGILNRGTLVMNTSSISDCSLNMTSNTMKNGGGAGIANIGGSVALTDSIITNCTITAPAGDIVGGAGIYSTNGSVILMDNSTITDCKVSAAGDNGAGGGIFFTNDGTKLAALTMNRSEDWSCAIEACSASLGGGVYLSGSDVSFTIQKDGTIDGCTALTGGGVYLTGSHNNLELKDYASIEDAKATTGGGVYINGTDNHLTMQNYTNIDECTAVFSPALSINGSANKFILQDSAKITDNTVKPSDKHWGSVMEVTGTADVSVINYARIYDNTNGAEDDRAPNDSAGILHLSGSTPGAITLTFSDQSAFYGNSFTGKTDTGGDGGGIWGTNFTCTANDADIPAFTNNQATQAGASVLNITGTGSVANLGDCSITDNYSNAGAVVVNDPGTLSVLSAPQVQNNHNPTDNQYLDIHLIGSTMLHTAGVMTGDANSIGVTADNRMNAGDQFGIETMTGRLGSLDAFFGDNTKLIGMQGNGDKVVWGTPGEAPTLKITNKVVDLPAGSASTFSYTTTIESRAQVTAVIYNSDGSQSSPVTGTDNTFNYTLNSGDTITFSGMDYNSKVSTVTAETVRTNFTVTAQVPSGFTSYSTAGKVYAQGTVAAGDYSMTYTNTYDAHPSGPSLRVENTVYNASDDSAVSFHYNVYIAADTANVTGHVYNADGSVSSTLTFSENTVEFDLKSGQYALFTGVQKDWFVQVTQWAQTNYMTTVTVPQGFSSAYQHAQNEGRLTDGLNTVSYVNRYGVCMVTNNVVGAYANTNLAFSYTTTISWPTTGICAQIYNQDGTMLQELTPTSKNGLTYTYTLKNGEFAVFGGLSTYSWIKQTQTDLPSGYTCTITPVSGMDVYSASRMIQGYAHDGTTRLTYTNSFSYAVKTGFEGSSLQSGLMWLAGAAVPIGLLLAGKYSKRKRGSSV